MTHRLAASLLSADSLQLGTEIAAVAAAGVDALHVDIMDHHYVPNLSFGASTCRAICQNSHKLPVDVHLMTSPVDPLIDAFVQSGARRIAIHPETCTHLPTTLRNIQAHGYEAGIVLNPTAPLTLLDTLCEHNACSHVIMMAVEPGFGGQTFIPETLERLRRAVAIRHHYQANMVFIVDGGVTLDTIEAAATAGADESVIGSALFSQPDYAAFIRQARQKLDRLP